MNAIRDINLCNENPKEMIYKMTWTVHLFSKTPYCLSGPPFQFVYLPCIHQSAHRQALPPFHLRSPSCGQGATDKLPDRADAQNEEKEEKTRGAGKAGNLMNRERERETERVRRDEGWKEEGSVRPRNHETTLSRLTNHPQVPTCVRRPEAAK